MLYAAARPADPLLVHDSPSAWSSSALREDLREFLCHRLDRVNPHESSAEYRYWHGEAEHICDRLEGLLDTEGRELLRKYENALGAVHYLETMLLAERALLDGVRIAIGAVTEENVEL